MAFCSASNSNGGVRLHAAYFPRFTWGDFKQASILLAARRLGDISRRFCRSRYYIFF